MNKTVRKEWLKALRSGEYKQGKEELYNPNEDTYCCLGVLCELQGMNMSSLGMPEPEQCKKLGIPYHKFVSEDNRKNNITAKLASYNDRGWSFNKIADYIEAKL